MQDRQTSLLFLEIFIIIIVLALLASVAIPHVGRMINEGKVAAPDTKLHDARLPADGMLIDAEMLAG